ncbi:MAG: hypothetical protein IS860_00190 [Nitrosopumilus sp.]|nr:hypothetical protein [Nitrosopumilus sp.]
MDDGRKIAHIPKESWPSFTWYAIEFAIVLAICMLIAREVVGTLTELSPEIQNYVWWGITGLIFLAWYIGIRGFVLKKKILKNRY